MKTKALLEIGRVSNLPTCVSNATAGFYLGGGSILTQPWQWLAAMGATILFYEAGLVMNDLCDRKIDLAERPERPLPSGRLTIAEAGALTLTLFAGAWTIVTLYLPEAAGIALALTGLIALYNLVHARFGLSPLVMGACRGSVYLLAAAAAGGAPVATAGIGALLLAAYVAAVSFLAREEVSERLASRATIGKLLAGMCVLDGALLAWTGARAAALLSLACFSGTLAGHRRIRGT